jgi:ribose transport system ATP-binding protein
MMQAGRALEKSASARPLLSGVGIVKRYGVIEALKGVDVDIRAGEVHAIVGENGAGKSTLMKLFAGEERPTAGEIRMDGQQVDLGNPSGARAHGIAIVHQSFQLVDSLTVAENLFLDCLPTRPFGGFLKLLDRNRMTADAVRRLARFNLSHKAMARTASLTVAEKQIVEISRALAENTRLLILDEPTSALSAHEIRILFDHVRHLRNAGVAIVLIAHNIDEVLFMADRITVLRDGCRIATSSAKDLDTDTLVSMIVGRDLGKGYPKADVSLQDEVLQVELTADAAQRLALRGGEFLGIPTYIGSAVRDILAQLSGEQRGSRNTVSLDGRPCGHLNVGGRVKRGICLVPGDAMAESMIPKMTIEQNLLLPNLARITRLGLLQKRKGRELAWNMIRMLDIRPADPTIPVEQLSGGNRQKVAIAKWILAGARVLLMDDPTRGVDVGAKMEIYRVIGEHVKAGGAVVFASSELDELIGLADRILVFRGGRIVKSFEQRPFEKTSVLAEMVGSDHIAALATGELS